MTQGHKHQTQAHGQHLSNGSAPMGSGKRGISKKTKIIGSAAAFVLLFALGFGGFGLYQNIRSNAGGEDTLGDPSLAATASQGLKEAQQTSTFSLQSEDIAFKTGDQEGYSATSPYPVTGGTYRIVRTTSPTAADSWVQIKPDTVMEYSTDENSTTGKGWIVHGTVCYGDGGKGYCDSPEQSGERLPESTKPGEIYYYRTELKQADGTWKPINDEVATFTVPKPTVSFTAPTYGEADRWDSRSTSQNVVENPLATVTWTGDGEPYYDGEPGTLQAGNCFQCTLYSSRNADMSERSIHYIPSGGKMPTLSLSGSTASVSQAPGSTLYYALYHYVGAGKGDNGDSYARVSDITPYTTPTLKNAPALTIIKNTETVGQYGSVTSYVTFGGDLNGQSTCDFNHSPFTYCPDDSTYIVERSTSPDAVYSANNPNSKQWKTQGYVINDYFDKSRLNTTYYYRVSPSSGTWTHSGQTWSQIVKVDPPSDTNATYYPTPTLSVSSVTHNKIDFSATASVIDARGATLQMSRDNIIFYNSGAGQEGTIKSSFTGSLSTGISENTTYFLRLAYFESNFSTSPKYTSAIKVRTLTDPYAPRYLSCSLTAPAYAKPGQTIKVVTYIKNNGTNTFAGTVVPRTNYRAQLRVFAYRMDNNATIINKVYNVGAIKPKATIAITQSFTVPKSLKAGKRLQVWAYGANTVSPCSPSLRKTVPIR